MYPVYEPEADRPTSSSDAPQWKKHGAPRPHTYSGGLTSTAASYGCLRDERESGGRVHLFYHQLDRYTVTTRMTLHTGEQLRETFECFINCVDKVTSSVHKPQFLKRKESRSGSNRGPSAYQHRALPLGHTGSLMSVESIKVYYGRGNWWIKTILLYPAPTRYAVTIRMTLR